MIGKVYKKQGGAGSSDIVNGIIEQYKASTDTISANSFVEFVNDYSANYKVGTPSDISESYYDLQRTVDENGSTKAAILVDTNKVIIFYSKLNNLYGVVCTINNMNIIVGTETQVAETSYVYYSAELIETNKVIMCYKGEVENITFVICSINGTSITINTTYSPTSMSISPRTITKIDNNKFYVSGLYYGSQRQLYGIVCTINGTTISATSTQLFTDHQRGNNNFGIVIDTNKVFIAHRYNVSGTNNNLYGVVCTISGTTITKWTDTALVSTAGTDAYPYISLISANKVFITHSSGTSIYTNGIVCTISGTTISKGTDTSIDSSAISLGTTSCLIEENKLFVANRSSMYGMICTISGTSISVSNRKTLDITNSSMPSLVQLSNKIFLKYRNTSTNKILGAIIDFDKQLIYSNSKIDGLTKTEATTSTAGDVWVLNN